MNMSTFYCEGENISMISVEFNLHLYAHTLTRMLPHSDGSSSTATHISWDFICLILSGCTCAPHGLLSIHLKSNQTKKIYSLTSEGGACIQFETRKKERIQQAGGQRRGLCGGLVRRVIPPPPGSLLSCPAVLCLQNARSPA